MTFGEWLEQRVGWRKLIHESLDEPIPGGSRWAYVFGSGLLFIFLNQAITGMFLAMYYVPSADHAHTTVEFIQKQVTAGGFIRSLHHYGSSVMVVLVLLHLGQTLLFGSYKSRRELLWLMGCILFMLVLGMSFTGYLLPWDQKAYAATAVATNIISEVPLVGSGLKAFLRGGNEMGTLTLTRFFAFHVFFIPGLIIAGVAAHVFLFRRAGAAGPPKSAEEIRALPKEPFFPGQVFKDFGFGILLIGALMAFAIKWPTLLGPMANPSDPTYLPRPEWYYVPIFEWLKFWPGRSIIVGIVIIPVILLGLLFGLPFIDRRAERRPWRRPFSVGGFVAVLSGLVGLGVHGYQEDRRDPAVHEKLLAQEEEELRFAKEPFQPEETSPSVGTQLAKALSPAAAKGLLLFASESCLGCHGPEAKGGAGKFRMADVGKKHSVTELRELIRNPNAVMVKGGMEAVQLPDEELNELIEYLTTITAGRT
jgi:ubiquinol-cytochrome c reductase cytochrome b subunit